MSTGTSTGSLWWCHCPKCGVVYEYEYDSENFQQPPPSETLTELSLRAGGTTGTVSFWLKKRVESPAREAEYWREHAVRSIEFLRLASLLPSGR